MAIVPGGFLFNLSPLLALLTIVPFGLLFAPQPMRVAGRRVGGLLVALGLASGAAFVSTICDWCPYCFECWWR